MAKLVIEDGIDILVDLSGHTAGNRLPVFARRPAPVQVSYLGYPNTTGLEQIDYRLTDELADPVGESDRLHSESLMRLATGFLCYSPATDTPPVSEAPVLSNGFITFASFNNVTKVNESVVAAWAAILNGLPGSRLLLKSRQLADRGARRRLLELFYGHGVEPPRIQLRGGLLTRSEHLETYARVDIALDPFPYNGTTTTCEALWMGVPVIALAGQVHRGRVGASILHYSGLDELLAQDVDAYVHKALALAGDGQALVALRQSLRQRMASSTLMDAEAAVRDLENAYGEMWRRHLASTPAGTPRDSNANDIARLNIGGTERRDGWKILNILPGPEVDYVGDCTDLTQLADASVDDVYASHVLEHLGYGEDLASSLGHISPDPQAGRKAARQRPRSRRPVPPLSEFGQRSEHALANHAHRLRGPGGQVRLPQAGVQLGFATLVPATDRLQEHPACAGVRHLRRHEQPAHRRTADQPERGSAKMMIRQRSPLLVTFHIA